MPKEPWEADYDPQGPDEEFDPEALANDGLVDRVRGELEAIAKKYGFTIIQGIFLRPVKDDKWGDGTHRFFVGVGDIWARYGATQCWVDGFKATQIQQQVMGTMIIMPPNKENPPNG